MIRLVLLLLPLAACTTSRTPPPPVIVPQEVVIAGPAASCVPASVGVAPTYPDTDTALRASAGPAERYQLLAGGRKLRDARLSELEPVVESCRK